MPKDHRLKVAVHVKTAGLALVVALVGGLVSPPTQALADTPNCVTWPEWQWIEPGMRLARVHRIFDTDGQSPRRSTDPVTGTQLLWRSYPPCQGFPYYTVQYSRPDSDSPWKVVTKYR